VPAGCRSRRCRCVLSDLDGFLTGIPSEWLPVVFGGNAPEFADEAEAKAIIMLSRGERSDIRERASTCRSTQSSGIS